MNHGNINVGPIETEQPKETRSKNRGYEEIDQLDFTTSNGITAAENIGNVDEEQGKAYDLEKSWEFAIPECLKRIHKHREDLATTVDTTDLGSYSRVAETWWRIIDACDPKLTEIITKQEFISLKETLLSVLPSDWKVLEPPLDENGLKKVGKITAYHGVSTEITTSNNVIKDEDAYHPE
ncbi:25789_t:CDS:2, partial [Gigaspora margarita]